MKEAKKLYSNFENEDIIKKQIKQSNEIKDSTLSLLATKMSDIINPIKQSEIKKAKLEKEEGMKIWNLYCLIKKEILKVLNSHKYNTVFYDDWVNNFYLECKKIKDAVKNMEIQYESMVKKYKEIKNSVIDDISNIIDGKFKVYRNYNKKVANNYNDIIKNAKFKNKDNDIKIVIDSLEKLKPVEKIDVESFFPRISNESNFVVKDSFGGEPSGSVRSSIFLKKNNFRFFWR